jgi:peptidoglycan hydrolase-like protein with peptidoglycan-binding domain
MHWPTLRVAFLTWIVLWPEIAGAQTVATQPASDTAPGPIAAVQQQLREAGYNPGPVNGVMTEKTGRAIAAYARHAGRMPGALTAADADPIKRAQEGLRRLGLLAGAVDGALGPQTRDAIVRFEAARRLPIDPRVSDRLLTELEQAGAATATAITPNPPAGTAASAPSAPPTSVPAPSGPTAPGPTSAQLPEEAAPEALGRRQLPAWVNPPPIR